MFERDTQERRKGRVIIQDMTKEAVARMLRLIYLGEKGVGDDSATDIDALIDLYKAGHKYCMDPLKNWALAEISQKMGVDNALEVFKLSWIYEEPFLERAKDIVLKKSIFPDVEMFQEFLSEYPTIAREWWQLEQ